MNPAQTITAQALSWPTRRTLIVAGRGKPAPAELRRVIADDKMPDVLSPDEVLNQTYVDDRLFATTKGVRGWLARHLPFRLAQTLEVCLHAGEYDAVVTWSELPSLFVCAALCVVPNRPAHVAILMWPSRPKKAIPLWLLNRRIDRFIVSAPLQRRFLEERLHIDPDRILTGCSRLDTGFFRPIEAETDCICSVGQEMRDYDTLVAALRGTEIPCHIAVGSNPMGPSSDKWWRKSLREQDLPANVTYGRRGYTELRDLYARSRFVVIPLFPGTNNNGVNAILESFAMGKAIIATDSPGQIGLLKDGVNCLKVPPRDPQALRAAIERLWNDPELAARLGAAGREFVEREYTLERWTRVQLRAVTEAIEVHGGF